MGVKILSLWGGKGMLVGSFCRQINVLPHLFANMKQSSIWFDVYLVNVKWNGRLFQIFVAFSECPNFNIRVSNRLLIYKLLSQQVILSTSLLNIEQGTTWYLSCCWTKKIYFLDWLLFSPSNQIIKWIFFIFRWKKKLD